MSFDRARLHIRHLVRANQYHLTLHADEEMDNDEVSLFDLERVLTEGELTFRQRDVKSGELKYLLNGLNFGLPIEAVVKITSEQVVVITVYSLTAK